VPTVVLHGEADVRAPRDVADALLCRHPNLAPGRLTWRRTRQLRRSSRAVHHGGPPRTGGGIPLRHPVPVGSSMMPRIRPIRQIYVQARSAAAAEEGAGVTAGFGAAVRGGSAVTTRATPKIANPPPMSTTPVTGSDKITAPNTTATAGLT
jgi:hypothetical protein